MKIAKSLLLLSAILIIGVGVAFILVPIRYAAVLEISLPTAMARTDVRATYGGFNLAFGIFLARCALRSEWIRPGLLALGLAAAGFGGGRLIGMLVEGAASTLMIVFLVIEVATTVLVFLLLRRLPRVNNSASP